MAITEVDARQLVEAHQAGDERAFAEIARLAYASLYGHALRRLGDHHAAEDAVQETFVRAYRALPRFDGDFRLQAWLHRILSNVCVDEGSRRTREIDLVERIGSLVDDDVADPCDLTVTAATRTSVAGALAELPTAYRDAVALRYIDDLSYRDVAAATGVSEENARARASRGRAVLHRVLGRGVGVLVFVFPSLRRHRTVAADPSVASAGLVEHAGQVAVTSSANPIANLSAQLSSQVAQVAPVVTRLAEASASMGGARSTMVANVVGAIAAVTMPVAAYTIMDPEPPATPVGVTAADIDAGARTTEPVYTETTALAAVDLDSAIATITIEIPTTSTTVPVVAETTVKAPRTPAAEPSEVEPTDDGSVADEPSTDAEPAPPAPRHGSVVSDEMTVETDGSRTSLNGPVGFAAADQDTDPEPGTTGTLTGELEVEDADTDGHRWVTARLELVIDGREYVLRLWGQVVEESIGEEGTRYRFLGSYRLSDASGLGLERSGEADWSIVAAGLGPDGVASPTSSLRMNLGDQPDPGESDAASNPEEPDN